MGKVLKAGHAPASSGDQSTRSSPVFFTRWVCTCLLAVGMLLCLLLVSIIPAGCSTPVWGRKAPEGKLTVTDVTPMGKRVLVVAPHPDDEGLATAGLIQQALKQNVEVQVVIITAGDGSKRAARLFSKKDNPSKTDFRLLGDARCRETRDAMSVLGLPRQNAIFLAYADGSLNSLWNVSWDYNRLHTGRNGADHSPYAFAYEKNAPCCGSNLEENLRSIIKDFEPTSIIYPDAEDVHHDHWAANAFVQYAVISSHYRGKEYTYLVHRHDFPEPRSLAPLRHLEPPKILKSIGSIWQSLPLSRREESNKESALKLYTIPRMVNVTFIDSFVRRNELLGIMKEAKAKKIGNKKPDFTARRIPYVVTEDPSYDSAVPGMDGSDLTKVAFCTGDSRAYLAVETKGYALDSITYSFRLRLFKGSKVDRLDISVRGKRAHCERLASNSIRFNGRIPVGMRENRLWIDIPISFFSGKNACMLSVDSTVGSSRGDRSAWRRLTL